MKRIIAVLIAAVMLTALIPFSASADYNDPITLEIGFGEWTGNAFEGGYLKTPRIGAEVPEVWSETDKNKRLNIACKTAGSNASEQDYGYKITSASWISGTSENDYGITVFDWSEKTTLKFELYVESGWYIPIEGSYLDGSAKPAKDKISLKFNGAEFDGYELTGEYRRIVGSSYYWHMELTFTKKAAVYGNSEAAFLISGKTLESYKAGDAFPTNLTVTGNRQNFYTAEINWYYMSGEPSNYTRGSKVTETEIQPDTYYLCEITFRLKNDAPATVHRIDNNGSAECVLFNTESNTNIPGYFSWGQISGINDNPNERTLTVRRRVVYGKVVKNVVIEGITPPAIGTKPVDYGITFAAPFDDWAVKSATWSGSFEEEGVFLSGEKYYLNLVIEGAGDLRELNEANGNPIPQGYTLAQANAGRVVSFKNEEGVGLTMKIEFLAGLEDYHTYTIDMSKGKTEIDLTDKALLATLEAMKAVGDVSYTSVSALEENYDLDNDGTWDVVVQNGKEYQPHDGASVKGRFTVKLSEEGIESVKSVGSTAYYSKIMFVFDGSASGDLKGDVNLDGFADNKDVVLLFRFVSAGSEEYDSRYDFNEDGLIDNKDVVSLFRYVSTAKG